MFDGRIFRCIRFSSWDISFECRVIRGVRLDRRMMVSCMRGKMLVGMRDRCIVGDGSVCIHRWNRIEALGFSEGVWFASVAGFDNRGNVSWKGAAGALGAVGRCHGEEVGCFVLDVLGGQGADVAWETGCCDVVDGALDGGAGDVGGFGIGDFDDDFDADDLGSCGAGWCDIWRWSVRLGMSARIAVGWGSACVSTRGLTIWYEDTIGHKRLTHMALRRSQTSSMFPKAQLSEQCQLVPRE